MRENPVKIAVLVSGGGTNLQALIDAGKRGELGDGKITCVISSKADAYALTRAEKAGIKTAVVPKKGVTQEDFEAALIKEIEDNNIDFIIEGYFVSSSVSTFFLIILIK